MNWATLALWLNRAGMLAEFLSFWLAAPEIITEIRQDNGNWLLELTDRISSTIKSVVWALRLPHIFLNALEFAVYVALSSEGAVLRFVTNKRAREFLDGLNIRQIANLVVGITGIIALLLSTVFTVIGLFASWAWWWVPFTVSLSLWLLGVICSYLAVILSNYLRVLTVKRIRRQVFLLGIILFVSSFCIQFIATFS